MSKVTVSNKHIVVIKADCCTSAHAVYLEHLIASGNEVSILALVSPSDSIFAELEKEVIKSAEQDRFTERNNELSNLIAFHNTSFESEGNEIVKAILNDLSMSSSNTADKGNCQINPVPDVIQEECDPMVYTQALINFYEAEHLRIELEHHVAQLNQSA